MSALLVLLACTTADLDSDPTDTAPDTDADTDTDTDSDTDAPQTLTFELIDPPEGDLVVSMTWFAPVGDSDVVVGTALASTAVVDGVATLTPGAPPAELLNPLDADRPDMLGALYMFTVHEDLDGDGAHSEGEPFTGVASAWGLYLQEIDSVYRFVGFNEGWNTYVNSASPIPDVVSLDAIPVEANNLAAIPGSAFGGTFDGALPAGGAIFPYATLAGLAALPPLVDVGTLGSTWSMSVAGDPPASHQIADEDPDLPNQAIEVPLAYVDTDQNGSFSGQDYPALPACYEGTPTSLLWTGRPTTPKAAFGYGQLGLRPGWFLATVVGEDVTPLGPEAYSALTIGVDCQFPR